MKCRNLMMLALCLPLVACSQDNGSGSGSIDSSDSQPTSSEVDTTTSEESNTESQETTTEDTSDSEVESDVIKELNVASEEHLNWFGRTYEKDGSRYFHYSSSGFEVRFFGTKLVGTFGATEFDSRTHQVFLSVLVDGDNDPRNALDIKLDQQLGNYTIVENLQEGMHTVRVLKRTESQYSKCWLEDLTTDGEFHKPLAKKERRIEVFGASTSCGFGVFGESGPEPFRTETESSLFSFGGLTSRVFDAEYNMETASGWAITQNKVSNDVSMLNCYDKMDLRSQTPWEMSKFIPDIILVNLATNDSVYINDAPTIAEKLARQRRYYNGYITFIDNLREAYGNPELPVLMCYGFLDDEGVAEPIKEVKAHYAAKGDAYVDFVHVLKSNDTDGYGSAYHPSATTHMRATNQIVPKVQQLMDNQWDIVNPNLTSVKK